MQEFALHVTHEYDYRFKTPIFETVVTVLCGAYEQCTGEKPEVVQTDVSEVRKQAARTHAHTAGATRCARCRSARHSDHRAPILAA